MPTIDYDFPVKGSNSVDLFQVIDDWKMKLENVRQFYPSSIKDDEVREFVKYLIDTQRTNTGREFANGSWTVPEDVVIGDGAGFDFATIPSFIAIAFLCYVKQEIPQIANEFKQLNQVIRAGLDYCSINSLQGCGYESTQESLRGIEILAMGKVFHYVNERPGVSPNFSSAIAKARKIIKNRLKDNTGWGAIDEEKALVALKYLDGEKINIETDAELNVATKIIESMVESIAAGYLIKLNQEISEREGELLKIAQDVLITEKSKQKYVVFESKRDRSPVRSEKIKLKTSLNLDDMISIIKSKCDYETLGITSSLYKNALINVLSGPDDFFNNVCGFKTNGELLKYLNIENDFLKDNGVHIDASNIEFDYQSGSGYIYIYLVQKSY